MSPKGLSVSADEARRIAVAAQGFGGRKPAQVTAHALRSLILSLGAVQIDSVNVLVRSQYLPAFSRLGSYDRKLLDRVAYGRPRRIFEYWGHEASLLSVELYPLLHWRMKHSRDGAGVWANVARVGRERPDLLTRVREEIAARGPLAASDFEQEKRAETWWGWTDIKRAGEFLFGCGEISPLKRRSSFERVYDLTERIIPRAVLDRSVDEEQAYRELVDIAARSFGVATESDLRDYFRLPHAASKRAVAQLVDAGALVPVNVENWKPAAYLHAQTRRPRKMEGSALLSPFDSLVWNRPRVHRLFDFHYRIEIYTPAHKRVHGYYVLPYLLDGKLVARVDLKADREPSTLRVHAVHYEPKVDPKHVAGRLREDLAQMAQWLQLVRVRHSGTGRTR